MGLEALVGSIVVLLVVRFALANPTRSHLAKLFDVGVTLAQRTAEVAGLGLVALGVALLLFWDAARMNRRLKALEAAEPTAPSRPASA